MTDAKSMKAVWKARQLCCETIEGFLKKPSLSTSAFPCGKIFRNDFNTEDSGVLREIDLKLVFQQILNMIYSFTGTSTQIARK